MPYGGATITTKAQLMVTLSTALFERQGELKEGQGEQAELETLLNGELTETDSRTGKFPRAVAVARRTFKMSWSQIELSLIHI